MTKEPDIFSGILDVDVRTFAAMAKASGLGSAVVIQAPAAQTGDPPTESLTVVHTADLSRMMGKVVGNVGVQTGGYGHVLPKPRILRHLKRHSAPLHEAFQLFAIDPHQDTVDTVPSEDVEAGESHLLDVIRNVLPESEAAKTTARDLLRNKAITAIVKLIDEVDEQTALEALSAPDDMSALVWFLASPGVTRIFAQSTHPLAASLVRGVERRRQLLSMEGGTASGQEFAEALGISRQAVDKRRRAGDLLAIPSGSGDWRYPWWQLREGRVLPDFKEVMTALDHLSPWACMDFFLSPDERLGGRRPLDALRSGEGDAVIQSARAEGEQGAR